MYFIIPLIVTLGVSEVYSKVSCIGEDGKAVDMFIMYKLPRVAYSPGSRYLYLDSNNLKFRSSKHRISGKTSPPAKTLKQVYRQYDESIRNTGSQSLAHIFYNDAVPGSHYYDFSFGHTKGELAFDKETGFWIIQSVPNFPTQVSEGYHYPRSGYKYGQMLMCISFNSKSFKDIGLQLKYAKPHIYDSNLPTAWQDEYKEIHDVIKGTFLESSPASNIAKLTSLKGTKYLHFSKNAQFGHDIYHQLVAPTLGTNLVAETWQHGKHNIGPSCKGKYTVVDIRKVSIKVPGKRYSFLTLDDHSKYAISKNSDSPFVCVCDINRQYTQYKRGGGCMCVRNNELWKQFHGLIGASDSCNDHQEIYENIVT